MKKESRMENKTFQLFPIGKLKVEGGCTTVHIMSEYRPALQHLEFFSHVIVFMKPNGKNTFPHCPEDLQRVVEESLQLMVQLRNNEVDVIVAKVLKVNMKKGIVELDYGATEDDTVVFDLKPYFPCEDRVKDVKAPNFMKQWPEWRFDVNKDCKEVENTKDIFMNIQLEDKHLLHPIGKVKKINGECFLQLKNLNTDFFKTIKEFSHIKILWWFDRFDKSNFRKVTQGNPPYENAPRTGIFATRSPVRPNPIAMTTARILDIDVKNREIKVSELDAFDKTSVVEVIPYIPALDRVNKYDVPKWLKHWPEWLDDREGGFNRGEIEMVDGDIQAIKKYLEAEKEEAEEIINLFQKEENSKIHSNEIIVRGARQNNLKNVSCTIPKNKITVVTGVSGSGKSSLAFDTIYAESQRRFMDSITASRGAFYGQMAKSDFDQITGLPPAVAIEQKNVGRNPRSTVGTLTDIYDYLRLLFSKIGTRHCPDCGRGVTPLKTAEIVKLLELLKPGTIFSIKPFDGKEALDEFIALPQESPDRNLYRKRLKDTVEAALALGNGGIIVTIDETEGFLFQTREMCYHCKKIFFQLSSSTFSFNNPDSMCPVCRGLGIQLEIDTDLIVSKPEASILDGASNWWGDLRKFRKKPNANWMKGEILALAEVMKVNLELPWEALPEDFKHQAIYGSDGKEVKFTYENTNGRKGEIVRPVEGAYNIILRLFKENSGDTATRLTTAFMREQTCTACNGERLAPEGRLVTIGKTRFPETTGMTIEGLKEWIKDLPKNLAKEELELSIEIIKELYKRLDGLVEAGVSYLSLDRPVPTLSGGELQRLRLTAQLNSNITSILYVLDEPSTGLHPKDHRRLIKMLQHIRDEGNTVLVVEHDADTMLAADKIIDIGPGAGLHGGTIIAEGTPEEMIQNLHTETGKYLAGINDTKDASKRSRKKPYGWIEVRGARCNNLKSIDAAFPLGVFTCITGVSGSGKSSLVSKTLYPALAKYLGSSDDIPGEHDTIEGLEMVDKVISISQKPIGRTPRSNPATYTGVFDHIRSLFTTTEEAQKRGFKQNRFSFNSKEGQCQACKGEGRKCIEMHFMPDLWVECSVCQGKRFNEETLEIVYNGKTIAGVLEMSIDEALDFFINDKKISIILQTLSDVGLGYIKLGQSALTLSGGEAQRIKLAKELCKTDTGKTIYLLDEPTTGLHFSDVKNLLSILQRITDSGNTVIVIEHNPQVMIHADWMIDLGPEGGDQGGTIIAEGTPEEVAEIENSYTGKVLKQILDGSI
ncbi:excinuclease ABC subunit A [Natronincola peptidivorans]|uniref:UvrABC system protein A n=1 Tax=Natronincola peptidivorans TaxID=426128 RepID=A0A1I0AX24_9FIRM|nr:excinuclease ABC subunit UvrA [Natronincola peptidivorans]SES98949.1 excinuclease ABC subunit A [Natronincola peptidivorans]